METLPREITELIIHACDPKTLAVSIPQVSKLFKKYSDDDGNIWKAKCEQKFSGSILNSKTSDQTWKQFYFIAPLKLFPFYGQTINKTTHKELLALPNAVASQSDTLEFVKYENHNFWIEKGIFDGLYITYTSKLPDNWLAQGLSFEISWAELKDLLTKRVGNYQVEEEPHYSEFQGKDCFTANMTSIVKEGEGADAIYYKLSFDFAYAQGDETTHKTLYKIEVNGTSAGGSFVTLYEAGECNDQFLLL